MTEISTPEKWSANFWVLSSVLSPIVTFGISYPLAISEGNVPKRGGAYFPSDSINEWPDRVIGTFGLGFSAWCLSHLFYYHYLFLNKRLPEWKKTTFVLLLLGEFCTVMVFGVGAIQTGISPFWHSFCAYNAFGGFNIYIAISTWLIDGLIQQKCQDYRRGVVRILSAIGGPIMLFLHLGPLTRGFTSSLAEIGLLACFLLFIASQYNVWGRVYIVYKSSFKCSIEFGMSDDVSSKYKKMKPSEVSSDFRNHTTTAIQLSSSFQKWEDQIV